MKKIPYLFLVLTFFGVLPAIATTTDSDRLTVLSSKAQKSGNDLFLEFVFDYSQLSISPNDQLILQPVILGAKDTVRLPYLLFPGKTRNKANLRKIRLYGTDGALFPAPYATLYPSGKTGDIFTYQQNITFANWMYGARVELWQDIYGCADCHKILAHIPLNNIANPPVVAFIIPMPDTNREERQILHIGFPWDQAIIRPGFQNNTDELDKINRSMQKIANAPSGKIRRIELTGYASPEGKYAYNARLAGRRVQAVKNYLNGKYPVDETIFIIDTIPEDWEGVKQWVENSGLSNSREITDIIGRIADPDARDLYIRRMDGNTTYKTLLREAYPPLRRVEYKIHYHATPLAPEQSRSIYQKHPERLSSYEMYMLANSYPEGTPEFSEIILTTVRLYPTDAAALNNAACIALQREDLKTAREYLLQSKDSPEQLNNQGVLLMLEGKLPEAYQCFVESGECGCQEAIINRHNLERAQLQY